MLEAALKMVSENRPTILKNFQYLKKNPREKAF